MARTEEAVALVPGKKRGPGRPRKSSIVLPPFKKTKRESEIGPHSPHTQEGLPSKIYDSRPLPSLASPQPMNLSDNEYASMATSGVIANSLERSRMSWTYAGVFDRYWTKPETGKSARPPPPNNPDVKMMKSRGRCRLRIEPHIFEVEVYVVEKPRLPPRDTYASMIPGGQQWQGGESVSPSGSSSPAQGKGTSIGKVPTDPVIAKLAQRAGSDPNLKALMREVAAGQATKAQLEVFQRHITELTATLKADENKAKTQAKPTYLSPAAQAPVGPPEVVFAFTTPGACQDRFLFPQNAIIESLTPQHMLASFFVTRSGNDAVDPAAFNPNKTYYFPVTIMVEVAYGREPILADVRRWVKPADEARQHMEDVLTRYERLSDSHLAMRLPFRTTVEGSSLPTSHAGTPAPTGEKERKKYERKLPMPATMYKKRGLALAESDVAPGAGTVSSSVKGTTETESAKGTSASKVKTEDEAPGSERRSTRTTRKSSRLSEL